MNFRFYKFSLSVLVISLVVNSDFFIDDNTLSVNVARLRKKLEAVGLKDFIETKKGVGYGLRHDG